MIVDADGWLKPETADEPLVELVPTRRQYSLETPEPLGLVWHTTDGIGGKEYARDLANRIKYYKAGIDRPASWHVLIGRDGTLFQSARFFVGTWHVGKPGTIGGHAFDNVNRGTIGVEIENGGRLKRINAKYYVDPYYCDKAKTRPDPRLEVASERAVSVAGDGIHDDFTAEQVKSARLLCSALVARFGWTPERMSYGHVHFDSPRKEDPGPVWLGRYLPGILDALFPPGVA